MRSGLTRRFVRSSRLLGALAVIVALVSQLALGAVVLPDDTLPDQLADLDAASVFCQSGAAPRHDSIPPAPHRAADHAICPLSVALALPAVTIASDPHLPAPDDALPVRPRRVPPARAPPSPRFATAYPRGPPRLV